MKYDTNILLSVDEDKPMKKRVAVFLLIFAIMFFCYCVYYWLEAATNSSRTDFMKPFWIILIVVWSLLFSFVFYKNKFELNTMGLIIKDFGRNRVKSWDSFHSFSVDSNKKEFILTQMNGSQVKLVTKNHFDEVKRILEEHITGRYKP